MENYFILQFFTRRKKAVLGILSGFAGMLNRGDDMQQAYEMAVDALGLSLTSRKAEGEPIPKPTEINKVDAEDGILAVVEFDMMEYQKKHNSRAIKKTLSIPEWLNEEAVARGVNFSQVLQEALMLKLNIGR